MKQVATEKHTIANILECLHLKDVCSHYEDVIKQAQQSQWSYEIFLLELLKIEEEGRRLRRVERYEKQSCLPAFKRISNFDLERFPFEIRQKISCLLEGDFVKRHENVLIFGNPGTGKTHFASALGHALIQEGKKVSFFLCSVLVQSLLQAKKELLLPKKLKELSRYDVLIIDEIGYIQQSRDEMEVLFTLLANRYEQGSIVITSNLPFSKWDEIFKDKMLAAAAIDRLLHHSIVLKLDVANYRIESKKSSK